MSFFLDAFQIVVGVEGGYTANPADPGGETKFGISKHAYPSLDIANLTLEQAQSIYERDYWTPAGCQEMPWERALCVFDCAVNQGLSFALALNAQAPTSAEFMASRALRYAQLPTFAHFGHGWMNRLFIIFRAAQRTPAS